MAKFTPPSGGQHPPKAGAHCPGPVTNHGGGGNGGSMANSVERTHGSNTRPPQK